MPAETKFQTKPQLAAEMLNDFAARQQMLFRYILIDSVYATNPDFIEAVESLVGVGYLRQAPENTPFADSRIRLLSKRIQISRPRHRLNKFWRTATKKRLHSKPSQGAPMISFGIDEKSPREPKAPLNTNSRSVRLFLPTKNFHPKPFGRSYEEPWRRNLNTHILVPMLLSVPG